LSYSPKDCEAWVPLDSGHIGSFGGRKCKGPLNGPGAEQGATVECGPFFEDAADGPVPTHHIVIIRSPSRT